MEEKVCRKCLLSKSILEFPNSKRYKDGKLNECKSCYLLYCNAKYKRLAESSNWLVLRNKGCRRRYSEFGNYGYELCKEKKMVIKERSRAKYPEKEKARIKTRNAKAEVKGNQLHHWSYNEEHYKDTIELTRAEHYKLHRFLEYDQSYMMYRTLEGVLLNTKESHLDYFNSIKDKDT